MNKMQPNNEIWYTATDGKIISPYNSDAFGANIVSNTYENGKGVIKFNGVVFNIGIEAFSRCFNLKSISIPDSVTEIGEKAFAHCLNLVYVKIPDSVTKIGEFAYLSCRSLVCVEVPDSITEIGGYVFKDCCNLTSISIPNSVIKIGAYAFSGCFNLLSINIPDSVIEIERFSFSSCYSLANVELPNSVTRIGDFAFANCHNLKCIEIPNSVTQINGTFADCFNLTSIIIPNSVTKIGGRTFWRCKKLKSINIPDSVTIIEKDAFKECSRLPIRTKLKIFNIKRGKYRTNTKAKYTYSLHGKTYKCYPVNLPNEDSVITRDGGLLHVPTESGGHVHVSLDNETENISGLNVYTCLYVGCHISLRHKRRVIIIDKKCEEKLARNEKIDVVNVEDYPIIKYETISFNDILFKNERYMFFEPKVQKGDIFLIPCYMDYSLSEIPKKSHDEVLKIIKRNKYCSF